MEHEISAYYDNLRRTSSGLPSPVLECSCGDALATGDSWEDAGREMDDHLAEIGSG